MPIRTVNVNELSEKTGSLYEAVAIMSKRSRQIATNIKEELDEKLKVYEGFGPEGEEIYNNEEQARISIDYEKKAKPTELAINEMLNDEIFFRHPMPEED